MNPEQVIALLAILADQRLLIDKLAEENRQMREALAERHAPPPTADA